MFRADCLLNTPFQVRHTFLVVCLFVRFVYIFFSFRLLGVVKRKVKRVEKKREVWRKRDFNTLLNFASFMLFKFSKREDNVLVFWRKKKKKWGEKWI
jgi:hypothetical protein